jgi:hypothetical protein
MAKSKRVFQGVILEAWERSAMSKADISRAVPGITPSALWRYLDGHKDVYMRERSAEAVLAALAAGPQGPKAKAMKKERA